MDAAPEHTDQFRAMDTRIDVSVVATERPLGAFASVRVLFEQFEERFSRFRSTSALSRLNAGARIDDGLFVEACRMAIEAFEFTGGLFNPMMLPALEAAGYDRTFSAVRGGTPVPTAIPDPREALSFDGGAVSVRSGRVDLGGIVKGWTVDVATSLVAADYADVLVNAGGDMRANGDEPGGKGWNVGIAGMDGNNLVWEGNLTGALATSTSLRRAWETTSGKRAHHLIDPRTGLPAESPFVQVSVWAEETWRAECWAKAILIGGEETLAVALAEGIPALAIRDDATMAGTPARGG